MSPATLNFADVFANFDLLLRGVGLTLLLWSIASGIGLTAGLVIGLGRVSKFRGMSWSALAFVEVFRNTPVLIQLIWFYYALPILSGLQLSAFAAALLALSLNGTAYCAEIWRGGFLLVNRSQWEAGQALGMTHLQLLHRVILPQAIGHMLPAFTNRAIELAKNTSIASIVTVHELMYQARLFSSQNYAPLETFSVVALIYFFLIYPLTLASYRLERRFASYGK